MGVGNFFVAFVSEVNPFSNDVAMYFFYAGLMVMFDILFGLINWNYKYRTQMAAGTADVEASAPGDMGVEMDDMPEELADDDGKGGAFGEGESTLADAYGDGKDHGAYAAEDFAHGQYEEGGTYAAHSTQTAYGGDGAYGGGAYEGGEYVEGGMGSYPQAHVDGGVGVNVERGGAADGGEWNGFDDDL